ncbi:MAG: DUF350 domain-containing protein [Candidatus Marinimicrobia bacterium]|nr:DUF350 domain-containing protein [Candidatus Neomarinimicrobiota bacterium]
MESSWAYTFILYLKAFGWALVASIGFAVGIGFAIKIFDLLSSNIDEWEEIRRGNIGVALIVVALIVMVGLLIYKVI